MGRRHRHQGDVEFVEHEPAAGHGEQIPSLAQADARPVLLLELTLPLGEAPQAAQGGLVQRQAGMGMARSQREECRGWQGEGGWHGRRARTSLRSDIPTLFRSRPSW